MKIDLNIQGIHKAHGLAPEHAQVVNDLINQWSDKLARNQLKRRYYDGKNELKNIGIAIPDELVNLDAAISWPAKAVDVLSSRSVWDGFVFNGDADRSRFDTIMKLNGFDMQYARSVPGQLVHSCSFVTVTKGGIGEPEVKIRFFNAERATAIWDFNSSRVKAGLTVVDYERNEGANMYSPSWVNVFLDDCIIEIHKVGRAWYASYLVHGGGRPFMEVLAYNPTELKPFGKSRISRPVMSITDNAVREAIRTEISAETYTMPQKYLLGAPDDAFDIPKYQAYISSIFIASKDEDGDVPQFGQLPQTTMQPHTDYMRSLAAQFSGATGIPISYLGIIHDQPASSEAILAAERELVLEAERMNKQNGAALESVARMVMAVMGNKRIEQLDEDEATVCANFKNPAMPSMAAQADAMMKIASVAPWIAETEVFLEQVGFDEATRRRMLNDKERAQGMGIFDDVVSENENIQQGV